MSVKAETGAGECEEARRKRVATRPVADGREDFLAGAELGEGPAHVLARATGAEQGEEIVARHGDAAFLDAADEAGEQGVGGDAHAGQDSRRGSSPLPLTRISGIPQLGRPFSLGVTARGKRDGRRASAAA
jgi:hypothetical protein